MNNTWIISIIDKSGSMYGLKDDTIGGYNGFIEEQRGLDGKASVTTILFSSSILVIDNGIDIKECTLLDKSNYSPSGGTALLDAIGTAIDNANNKLADMPKEERPDNIICVILTDGEENSSSHYTNLQISNLVKHQTELHNWQFLFLGVGIDAFAQSSNLGIGAFNTTSITADSISNGTLYRGISKTVSDYRTEGTICNSWKDDLDKNFK